MYAWLYRRRREEVASYVTGQHGRRLMVGFVSTWVVGLVLMRSNVVTRGGTASNFWTTVLLGATAGVLISWAAVSKLRQAQEYRNGWIDGRRAMLESLREANQRDINLGEWVVAELERDAATLGYSLQELIRETEEDEKD